MDVDAQHWVTRTLGGHLNFLMRNLTPRTLFANAVALLWAWAASKFVRWLLHQRAEGKKRQHLRDQRLMHQGMHAATTARLDALGFAMTNNGTISMTSHSVSRSSGS